MYEGIKIYNGGKLVDLNALKKSDYDLVLNGIDTLNIILEGKASYNDDIKIMENNKDILISLGDANGNDFSLILKGLVELLLTNNSSVPVFEVFHGAERLESMLSTSDLEASASGGEILSSVESSNGSKNESLGAPNSANISDRINDFQQTRVLESKELINNQSDNSTQIINLTSSNVTLGFTDTGILGDDNITNDGI
ncbi:MAG: hypothetical protein GY932_10430, partial [Arcobacter sp.]|nr:hypothetical protein [Arcobacter sp.]